MRTTHAHEMLPDHKYIGTHDGPTELIGKTFTFLSSVNFQPDMTEPDIVLMRATVVVNSGEIDVNFSHADIVRQATRSDADADAYPTDSDRTFACLVMTARTYMSMTGENVVNTLAVMGENLSPEHKITVTSEPWPRRDLATAPDDDSLSVLWVNGNGTGDPLPYKYNDLPHGVYFMRPADSEPACYVGPFEKVFDAMSSPGRPPAVTDADDFDPAFGIVIVNDESSPLGYK